MALVRWDPFRDLLTLQQQMSRVFDDFSGRFRGETEGVAAGAWAPPVDIFETAEAIVLKAEVAGVEKEQITVEVHGGTLTLRGEKRDPRPVKEEDYHRMERSWGTFHRSFSLPTEVDASKIRAKYRDGVLEVTIPKSEAARPSKVRVEVSG